jgi:hypothetical protein
MCDGFAFLASASVDSGRKRFRNANETMSNFVAERLVKRLD